MYYFVSDITIKKIKGGSFYIKIIRKKYMSDNILASKYCTILKLKAAGNMFTLMVLFIFPIKHSL